MFAECAQIVSKGGLPASLFLGGFAGGFSHCAGMCGPFVIAQTGHLERISALNLFTYHFGRLTTYTMLAVLANSVFNLAFVASPLRAMIAAPLLALAGVIFLANAFPKIHALFPWAAHLRVGLPQGWLNQLTKPMMNYSGPLKNYMLGVVLGFMPCGLVLSALLAASTAPHLWQAGIAMAAFSIGTMPALLAVSIGGRNLKAVFPQASGYLFRAVAVFNGLWLIAISAYLLRTGI